jgi:hypothetical protein
MSSSDHVFMNMMRQMSHEYGSSPCYQCPVWNPDPKHLPVWDAGEPNRPQVPVVLPENAPVYSVYSGNIVGYGPRPFGVPCDAPKGHPNYGKNFHVIQKHSDGNFVMHRMTIAK